MRRQRVARGCGDITNMRTDLSLLATKKPINVRVHSTATYNSNALQTTVLDWVGSSANVRGKVKIEREGKAEEHCLRLCVHGALDSCWVRICKEMSTANRKYSACSVLRKGFPAVSSNSLLHLGCFSVHYSFNNKLFVA